MRSEPVTVRPLKVFRAATESRDALKRLVNGVSCSHVVDVMKHLTARQIVVCLLGLMLSLGMGLSAVQANNMTVDMALAGDMDGSGSGGCTGCGGDDTAKSGSCFSICASSVFMMQAPTTTSSRIEPSAPFFPDTLPLRSTAFSPDPHPPRPTFLL